MRKWLAAQGKLVLRSPLGEDHFALTIDLQNMFEIDRQRPAATLTNALGRLG